MLKRTFKDFKTFKVKMYICINDTRLLESRLSKILYEHNADIVCIGTPKHPLDFVGPYIGTSIYNMYFGKVYGTLATPLHALNINEFIQSDINKEKNVLAIDATMVQRLQTLSKKTIKNLKDKSYIILRKGPIYPGAGIDKKLNPVGDWSLLIKVAGSQQEFMIPTPEQIRETLRVTSLVIKMFKNIYDTQIQKTRQRLIV